MEKNWLFYYGDFTPDDDAPPEVEQEFRAVQVEIAPTQLSPEDIPPYPVQATQAPQKKCRIGAAAPPIPLISPQQISFAVNAVPQFPNTRPGTT